MEKKSYSYGMKIVGVIIHQCFVILFTIAMVLLSSLFSRSMMGLTDVGQNSFLDSDYYLSCIEEKYEQLSDYMHLENRPIELSEDEKRRYLQYKNEFDTSKTNFTYWYIVDDALYSNSEEYQEDNYVFDADTVMEEVRKNGDYLIYDVDNLEFETSIRGIEEYFFQDYNGNNLIKSNESLLIISIDTDFSYDDDLKDANREYNQLHPWTKFAIFAAILGAFGWIISLVYLTIVAGHREGKAGIALNPLDRVKTEILIAAFLICGMEITSMCIRLVGCDWSISGLLVAAGTVSWVADSIFLIFYLSMVRRIKAEVLWENSLANFLQKGITKTFREREVTTRVLILFAIHMVILLALAIGAFHYHCWWCLLLLLLGSAVECYIFLRKSVEHYQILTGVKKIAAGSLDYKIVTDELHGEDEKLGIAINNIGEGLLHAVDDSTKNERMKADLITNVSHDIKTPLTSIINYVNLIKREDIQNEKVQGYVKILDEKSLRLKQLTEDLVEASKISSGNIKLDLQKIDFVELIYQTGGEFNEKFEARNLTIVTKLPNTSAFIRADGRQLYRVIENLYNNAAKYALQKTRVYVEMNVTEKEVDFSIKNVSAKSLLSEAPIEDLTERFIRGDVSRTTEGSGLGLSIAKNLTQLMGGKFLVGADGDLFKVNVSFPVYQEKDMK